MTTKRLQEDAGLDNASKDPSDWVSGDEPATGAQKSYLHTLMERTGTSVPNFNSLTKAQAAVAIEECQKKGRENGLNLGAGTRIPRTDWSDEDPGVMVSSNTRDKPGGNFPAEKRPEIINVQDIPSAEELVELDRKSKKTPERVG
jgi:hypothetical protein